MDTPSGVPTDFADDPPDVTLRSDSGAIIVGPHSYSNSTMAADGTTLPPDGPAAVVDTAELVVDCPLRGWTLVAQAGIPGGATTPLSAEQRGQTSFRLVPPNAGTYDVWLTMLYGVSGSSYEASAGYVFRWIVP